MLSREVQEDVVTNRTCGGFKFWVEVGGGWVANFDYNGNKIPVDVRCHPMQAQIRKQQRCTINRQSHP